MFDTNTAISVEQISKVYRIGTKEEMHDSFVKAAFDFITSPLKNYRKYRSLYQFKDIDLNADDKFENFDASILWALKDVSFEVQKGELLGIIGRNGAGKSTLLKILCRIADPTSGRARVRGKISSLLEVGTGFHPELTGRENVYLNGTILGMTKTEVRRKFDEIVDFSGVEKFIDTPVKRYSSGMKVRLAFAVAAHLEPEILIIDEVLAVGDADFQKKCLNKMENVGQQGRTVVFVSHNLAAVCRLCTRAILLENGRCIEDGSPNQTVSNYLNAGFGTSAVRQWDDPAAAPSGDIARLDAVRVRADDGQVQDTIDIRRPFTVEMEYEVVRGGAVLLPVFVFNNDDDLPIFTTVDQDSAWKRRPRPEGRYISRVHIPGNFLAEGRLFVSCGVLSLNPEVTQFVERSTVALQVIDSLDGDSARGDYAKNIAGVVRPMLEWSTEFSQPAIRAAAGGA